jgi:hypothetical protein
MNRRELLMGAMALAGAGAFGGDQQARIIATATFDNWRWFSLDAVFRSIDQVSVPVRIAIRDDGTIELVAPKITVSTGDRSAGTGGRHPKNAPGHCVDAPAFAPVEVRS